MSALRNETYVLAYRYPAGLFAKVRVDLFRSISLSSTQTKLNDELIQITVFEPCCTIPLLRLGFYATKPNKWRAVVQRSPRR
jgi:hypothetical protein